MSFIDLTSPSAGGKARFQFLGPSSTFQWSSGATQSMQLYYTTLTLPTGVLVISSTSQMSNSRAAQGVYFGSTDTEATDVNFNASTDTLINFYKADLCTTRLC